MELLLTKTYSCSWLHGVPRLPSFHYRRSQHRKFLAYIRDFCVSRGPTTVPLTWISRNAVFSSNKIRVRQGPSVWGTSNGVTNSFLSLTDNSINNYSLKMPGISSLMWNWCSWLFGLKMRMPPVVRRNKARGLPLLSSQDGSRFSLQKNRIFLIFPVSF